MWLTDYYSSVFDVLSPACGFSVALSAAVLISMYKDIADSVTVRVSGMIGLSDALFQISQLVVRELALQPEYQTYSATARVFAFLTCFFQLLNMLLASRIALDLEANFLHWVSFGGALGWVPRHYVKVSIGLAFLCTCPLFFARASFDPHFLYSQWTFGSEVRDILYMVFGMYLWILLQLLNFALVIVAVIVKLRAQRPSENNPPNSLATHVMRTVEQRMRRKARILMLYPLSPIVFYTPTLIFYWVQTLHLEQTRVTTAIWTVSMVFAPLQSIFDLLVFVSLPPVQRVIRWYWTLHKDSDMLPLVQRGRRESIFVGHSPDNSAFLSTEEAWVLDVTEPRLAAIR
ncbi:hypothetical protein LPJ59_003177 [Coemansia sp. RSA 2399]|nr:hypothetical protein LPJ59_003177 [Coemansia sp. RSA 2399]KAJ1903885.1 hypothetical protein LPJ81_002823 [Coemansia sp. IMI 209127]